jgi:ribose transport system ATP-binding protein
MIRLMVGRELDFSQARAGHAAGDEVLRVESLSLPHPGRASDYLLKSVSFHVRRGEVLGIFGLMGAGRTELLETIFGLHAGIASGQVLVEGRLHPIRNPADAMRAGLALAPEDRKAEGLVLGMNVAENTTLASLQGCTQLGVIRSAKETAQAQSLTSRLGVKTPSLRQAVRNLSGGNQQKVVLAKWLATGPKVLLLDEPTRGIDVHAKREIYGLIEELVRSGLGVVLVSSELPEILAVADRIMVLCEGRVTGEFMRAEATEENLMRAAVPAREAA